MKASHKKILKLLASGHWFRRNDFSYRTKLVYRGTKFVGTVRQRTLDEMVELGILTVGARPGGSINEYLPVKTDVPASSPLAK